MLPVNILEPKAGGLIGVYTRTLIGSLGAIVLLWLIGLEGIYGHPTPFYAAPLPAFDNILIPGAFGILALTAHLLISAPFVQRTRLHTASAWGAVFLLSLFACAVFYHQFRMQSQSPEVFVMEFARVFRWHTLALAVFAGGMTAFTRVVGDRGWFAGEFSRRLTLRILGALVLFGVAFACAIAMLRGGPQGIAQAYARLSYEYIGDIGAGGSIRGLFSDYLRLRPHLSMHARVHPPGPIAILWFLSYFAGREPMALSIATIIVGALGIVPLYFWARALTSKRVALTCCMLYSVMPAVVLFTATSADIIFTPFTLTTLWLFTRAIQRPSAAYAAAAGIGYGILSILKFSLIGVGAYFALVGIWFLFRRDRWRHVIQTAALMLAAFIGFHVMLRWWSGFDVIACFRDCKVQFDLDQHHLELLTPRWPSWAWRFVTPFCWLFFAGIPASVLFVWRLRHPEATTRPLFMVLLLTIAALDLLYLARGEGERSALYVFPFFALPAGHLLDQMGSAGKSIAPLAATLAFMAFQCWLVESYLYTYW